MEKRMNQDRICWSLFVVRAWFVEVLQSVTSWDMMRSWAGWDVSLYELLSAHRAYYLQLGLLIKPLSLSAQPSRIGRKNSVETKRRRLSIQSHSDIRRQSLFATDNFLRVANDEVKPISLRRSFLKFMLTAWNRSIMKSLIEIVGLLVRARRVFPLQGEQWYSI